MKKFWERVKEKVIVGLKSESQTLISKNEKP